MTLRLKGSNSGDVSLKAPATAGDNTITLPTSNGSANQYLKNGSTAGTLEFGTLPVDQGPAFKASLSATQNFTASTNVKVDFDTEVFDTDSDYDHTTNQRFTPSKAGYYLVVINLFSNWDTSQYSVWRTLLFKNGSAVTNAQTQVSNSSNEDYGARTLVDLIYMNGSTDYIEAYVWSNAGSPKINDDATITWFAAHWVHS